MENRTVCIWDRFHICKMMDTNFVDIGEQLKIYQSDLTIREKLRFERYKKFTFSNSNHL